MKFQTNLHHDIMLLKGKADKVHSSVAFGDCDVEMQLTSKHMNFRGQGHLMMMAKGHL